MKPYRPNQASQNMIYLLRVNAGGELSTDRPCRLPMLVRVMLYGAISLIASFTLRCRLTWSQSIRSTLSCPDSSLSLSRCATLLRRRMGRAIPNGLTGLWHATTMTPLVSCAINIKPAQSGRQEPLSWGFCRLGAVWP